MKHEENFTLQAAADHRLLLVTFGRTLNDEIYMDAYHAVQGFMAQRGFYHAIIDFSAVEDFGLSIKMGRRIGAMSPAVPAHMQRIVVAPQEAIYGTAREVQTWREYAVGRIRIVKSVDAAYELLEVDRPIFTPVD
ncbi:MAG TPA: hypothetical protein VHY80_04195 [Stellaceae bacterium]|jgi:hypothetical protein|nr:hypothetical protein [Stellaceae bacterium]